MRRLLLLPLSLCLAACLLSAQDEAEVSKSMKTIGKSMGALRSMESKTSPEAVENAEKIVAAFHATHTYWNKKEVSDAMKWNEESTAAAEQLLAAMKAGEQEKAAAAYKTLGGSCRGCHDAHREKLADGSYKIK